jgi:tetratricopeptide (TPR) repeat protein
MRTIASIFATGLLATGLNLGLAAPASAQKGEPAPQPKCDRFKKGSNEWKRCTGTSHHEMSDEQLFYAGYWLARTGQYQDALAYLEKTKTQDARILTYIGFATRKLGNVDAAMAYYDRALGLDANYTVARAYMGEAFIAQGKLAEAKAQLAEIATRCGTTCVEHGELETALKVATAI